MNRFRGHFLNFSRAVLGLGLLANTASARIFTVPPPGANLSRTLAAISTLHHAGRLPRAEPVTILLLDGLYQLSEPLLLSADNSGTLKIAAAAGTHPVLSGGEQMQDWKPVTEKIRALPFAARGHVWSASIPKLNGQPLAFRELWVNGRKAVRARAPNDGNLMRLAAWDRAQKTATISAAGLSGAQTPANLEMIIDQVWEIAVLRIRSIQVNGPNARVSFQSPESEIEFSHPWPPVIVDTNYQAPFFLANAIEFLDSPGEWFEDLAAGKVYYWPRAGEDMTQAVVFAPALETLVRIEGTPDRPISNIQFQGITFAYSTWLRPSQQGHVPLQAGMYLLAAHKLSPKGTDYHRGLDNVAWIGRPPAAVSVSNADAISFIDCSFEHLAAAGLDLSGGCHDDVVQGCTFHDIGGNGLQLGEFSATNVETHLPWNPPTAQAICSGITIANNAVSECGNEDWGCTGIAAGYVRETKIVHNDVSRLPYTGISVGWGWTKMTNAMRDNLIFANHVHNVGRRLGDLGGIYTLSAQPGTVIAENVIDDIRPGPFVPDPDHWFYLYLDEGSSFITVRDNWCPAEKFLKNANGPGNVWTNNGPQVSQKIKDAAGLEPAFQHLLSHSSP